MPDNSVLNTISGSIEDLSRYATALSEKYIIDSPVIPLDKNNQTFVRIGRCKTGKTLLYLTEGGVEELLTAAPIHAKVAFMEIFENFFQSYALHGVVFWKNVDSVILKCKDCLSAAQEVVRKMEEGK